MPAQSESVSVVIPVYKSGEIADELHDRLARALRAATPDHEIILVDDCSPDDTWKCLSALAARDSHVTAIRLRKNAGYDNAILAGLRFATHELVVIMDDDLQHAPEDIPTLIDAIRRGHDVVYARFPVKRQTALKNLGSWVNGKLAQIIIQKPSELYLSPFKILRREIAQELVRYTGPYPYVDGLIFRVTSSIDQADVVHHERAMGHGHHGLLRSMRIMLNFLTTFSLLPLRIATMGGLAIALVASVAGLALVLANLLFGFGLDTPGWTSLLLIMMILGGGQLMAIGIVGEYVGRTYLNVGGRPQYVIGQVASERAAPQSDAE